MSTSKTMKTPLLRPNTERFGDDPDSVRTVEPFLQSADEKAHSFPKNVITTSRYTALNFFPKTLFEQFRRLANVYFVVIGIIAIIGQETRVYLTAIQPAGILLPVIIVILISVIKDGVEDIKRHKADKLVNTREVKVVTISGDVEVCAWRDLDVGSIVLLFCDEEIPADMVVLVAGGVQGNTTFVETAAIDGETNLKVRHPVLPDSKVTLSRDKKACIGLRDLQIKLMAELPNGSINHFDGSISCTTENSTSQSTLSEKNLMLRGSNLRASGWCVGMVVYTGAHTKLSLNSKSVPSKLSSMDRIVNKTLVIAIFGLIVVCVLSAIFQYIWISVNDGAYYLCLDQDDLNYKYSSESGGGCKDGVPEPLLSIFTFATLFNNFVCISMYVSLEMVYLGQAFFITQDQNLYDAESDTPADVHSSGLCADLGQIEYVLSDKTGTLTQNLMRVQRCSVNSEIFGAPLDVGGVAVAQNSDEVIPWAPLGSLREKNLAAKSKSASGVFHDFMRTLTVCNTVMLMPDTETGELNINNYSDLTSSLQAESADEVALVLAAAESAGIMLVGRDGNAMNVRIDGLEPMHESFEVLAINEFESDRKRMSVVARRKGQKDAFLFCKGADSSTLSRCRTGKSSKDCEKHIDLFASNGLRTLVMAGKKLAEPELNNWLTQFHAASNNISNRGKLLGECADAIEKDMDLFGAVGIEDALQDGVVDALKSIREMGLKTWMITGDKAETAVAIGQMSGLLQSSHTIHRLVNFRGVELTSKVNEFHTGIGKILGQVDSQTKRTCFQATEDCIQAVMRFCYLTDANEDEHHAAFVNANRGKFDASNYKQLANTALVVDGTCLEGIWADPSLQQLFIEAARLVPTVIACRVSPLQKATLVRMVKTAPGHPITLAIGDGANDVAMIHEARVGVGISGREGKHAANSSDFSIGQFRFLIPLLLEHGRYNYIRSSKLILYSFFKNLVLVSTLFYYTIYSAFSGTVPLNSIVFSGFNFYLGIPIIVVGVLDWDVPKWFVRKHPLLAYQSGLQREELDKTTFARYCIMAFLQGLVLFAVAIRFIAGNAVANISVYTSPSDRYDIGGVGLNNDQGQGGGIYPEGFTLYVCVVLAMNFKVMTMGTFNFLVLIGMVLSFMGFLLFIYVYNLFPSQDWFGVINFTFGTQGFWVTIVLVPMLITVFDFFAESALAYWFPTSRSKLHDKYMLSVESGEVPDQSSPNPTPGKTTDPSDYDPSQRL